jgi:hypothetical protein
MLFAMFYNVSRADHGDPIQDRTPLLTVVDHSGREEIDPLDRRHLQLFSLKFRGDSS